MEMFHSKRHELQNILSIFEAESDRERGKMGTECRGKSGLNKDTIELTQPRSFSPLPLLSTLVEPKPCCCPRTCWALIYAIDSCVGLAIVSLSVCAKGFLRAHLRPNNKGPPTPIHHLCQSHCQLYFSFGRIGVPSCL